jgi:hypothetical protein
VILIFYLDIHYNIAYINHTQSIILSDNIYKQTRPAVERKSTLPFPLMVVLEQISRLLPVGVHTIYHPLPHYLV